MLPLHVFTAPPEQPRLMSGEVHLWRADLRDIRGDEEATLAALLSREETDRAAKFHFEKDRHRFVVARGLMRAILSEYTNRPAQDLHIGTNQYGKPRLLSADGNWQFNLSHSGDLLLMAVTYAREVGVDLEVIRDDVPFDQLASHHFEAKDLAGLQNAQSADRPQQFFKAWTSTEARLKAAGTGFGASGHVVIPDRWSLLNLSPAPGYAAALAVAGGEFQLQSWAWRN